MIVYLNRHVLGMAVYSLFHIDFEFGNVGFCGGKTEEASEIKQKEKKLATRARKLKPKYQPAYVALLEQSELLTSLHHSC